MLASGILRSASPRPFDVIVSGGGLVGSATMAALQQLRERLSSEAPASPTPSGSEATATGLAAQLDRLMMVDLGKRPSFSPDNMMHRLRTVSITPVNSRILDNLGGWARLTTKHAYYRIAVRHEQANSPFLGDGERSSSFFMNQFLGSKTTSEPLLEFTDLRKPVGFICLNSELNAAMVETVEDQAKRQCSKDVLAFESNVEAIQLPPTTVVDGPWGTAKLVHGEAREDVSFGLLLGCEGRGSPLRDTLSTASIQHDYAQVGFVCDVRVDKQADGNVCCFQNFYRDGKIIAYLPLSDDSANIVFSTTPSHAKQMMAMSQEELVAELNKRLCSFAPNDIPKIVEVPEGMLNGQHKRAQGFFPLKLNVATTPYAPRALLIGDAAHGIHPFAGQGLNLGLYDVCALTDILETALRSGQDIGSSIAVGQAFAAEMMAHTAPMILTMEVIKQMAQGTPGLTALGMKFLNKAPVVSTVAKDAIMQVSSGAAFASRHPNSFLLA